MISQVRASRKISLKVDRGGQTCWTHFCYINPEIFDAFMQITHTRKSGLAKWLSKWAEEDFNWVIDFSEYSHIKLLKELVIDKYRRVYPHLYYTKQFQTSV